MVLAEASSRIAPRFGIRRQAALAAVLLLVVIGIVTTTAYVMHGRLSRSIEQTTGEARRIFAAGQVAIAAMHYRERADDRLAAGSNPARAQNPCSAARRALAAAIDDYATIDRSTQAEATTWRHLAEEAGRADADALQRNRSLKTGNALPTAPVAATSADRDDRRTTGALAADSRPLTVLINDALAAARRNSEAAEVGHRQAAREGRSIYWMISCRAILSFALAELIVLAFCWQLLRRIGTLTAAVERVAAGDLDTKLPSSDYDEIGVLAQKFNEMADALRNARERFELMVRGSADGTWEWNSTSDRIYFSPRFKQLLGYDESETEAFENFLEMIHPDERDSVYKMVFDHFEHQVPFNIDFRVRTRSGDYQWFHARGQAIWGDDGKATRIAGSISNIMGRYRAEQQLREAKDAAESANRAKSEFLANMSHEIRTPMTSILGFAEIMLENSSTPDNEEPLLIIKRNGEHLLEIINDILDLSKIEAGKVKLEQVPCSPSQIITDVAALMRVRADAKGLPLRVEFVGPIPDAIKTDPMRLRQILINLIGNAVKFTEVGEVRIVVQLTSDPLDQPRLKVDVIDTGIGLREEEISQLFQPFAQADTSTTRRFGGTGLGLTISKRLADMLGGAISVESEPGKGSRFTLTIATGPLDHLSHVEDSGEFRPFGKAPAAPCVLPPGLRCKALLAEDGPDNQRLIAYVLRKFGTDVVIADNGKIAVDLVLAAERDGEPFQVVLMDMQMPVLDGYNATRQLRQAGWRRTIVALTAHAMEGDREKCLAAGCDEYEMKPIERPNLFKIIRRWAVPAATAHGENVQTARG